ncbi:hypothetical protein GCM10029992_39310 [Glycomyces albus]
MSSKKNSGPDDYAADFVLLLAFIGVFVTLFTEDVSGSGMPAATVALSILGVGLKIASAIRHAGRGSAGLVAAV